VRLSGSARNVRFREFPSLVDGRNRAIYPACRRSSKI
jgi:hypothetical protein